MIRWLWLLPALCAIFNFALYIDDPNRWANLASGLFCFAATGYCLHVRSVLR